MISQMSWTSYTMILPNRPYVRSYVVIGKFVPQFVLFNDHLEDIYAHYLMFHEHFGIAVPYIQRVQVPLGDVSNVMHKTRDTNAQLLLLCDLQFGLHLL